MRQIRDGYGRPAFDGLASLHAGAARLMCASYGLDLTGQQFFDYYPADERTTDSSVRDWFEQYQGTTVRPTGKRLRNLNPMLTAAGAELGWWGYLKHGEPVKWPSINARSERLIQRPGGADHRAVIPATNWFEYQQPGNTLYSLTAGGPLGIAAVTISEQTPEGEDVTCYSLIMRPAAAGWEHIHDRMPVLLPLDYYDEWLDPARKGSSTLIEEALALSYQFDSAVAAVLAPRRPRIEPSPAPRPPEIESLF